MISKKTMTTIRRWNAAIHRDLGYFFVGMTLIYAISGIALNHLKDWNPNTVQKITEVHWQKPLSEDTFNESVIQEILAAYEVEAPYNKHFIAQDGTVKTYLKGGTFLLDLHTGQGRIEVVKKRFLFNELNFLHYNAPRRWWMWFSDAYAVGMVVLALSGLFILKGKKGLKWRGTVLGLAGLLLPLALFWWYKP
jgi:hypothetical protein